jgi:plasminogen activator inhibitor 1 RNA-binding protein
MVVWSFCYSLFALHCPFTHCFNVFSRRPNQHDRNTKHGRGGRAPPRDGKRQYDRRSGTGRGKEIKKDGGGAHNWGSDKDEAKTMEEMVNVEEVAADEEPKNEEAPAFEEEPEHEPEPEPEQDNTMTYAEYMASKGKKEENAGREVENEFKGISVASKKAEEDFLVMGGGKQKKAKKKKDDEKRIVDVGFRVVRRILC